MYTSTAEIQATTVAVQSCPHPGLVHYRDVDPNLRVGEAFAHIREGIGHPALHLNIAHPHKIQGLIAVQHQGLNLAIRRGRQLRRSEVLCWLLCGFLNNNFSVRRKSRWSCVFTEGGWWLFAGRVRNLFSKVERLFRFSAKLARSPANCT